MIQLVNRGSMVKKILYFMHVDWRWIKQRPHFIAEGLSSYYDVTVVHFCSKHFLFREYDISDYNLNILPALRLPFYQNKIIYALNREYIRIYFKFLIKKYNPDFIWITFPQLYDYMPTELNCKLIYDCMDLATGFDFSDDFKSKISEQEEKLVNDANLVLVSSDYLFKRLNNRDSCEKKLLKVRNAFNGQIIKNKPEKKLEKPFKIGYVGTISQWINLEDIKKALDKLECIEFHFIGPLEIDIKLDDRTKFYGVIRHENLYEHVKDFDCLIMPFKLNALVKSVDPVKLYEYINFNKPIISIYYEELDYFSSFLYFYSNVEELLNLFKKLINTDFKRKYSNAERIRFLKENSWDKRVKQIIKNLNVI